jgi:Holliday junction resolvase RusA-like endonuclease
MAAVIATAGRWVFTCPFPPEPKRRPRVAFHGGKARAFTPPVSRRAEDRVRMAVAEQLPEDWTPLTCAVFVDVTAYRAMPKSIPKCRQETALPTTRPDSANYGALVCDAISAGLVLEDDSLIVDLGVHKRYGRPRWEITVEIVA